MASFGTGQPIRKITAKEACEWGLAEWALPIIDVLFDGASDAVDYAATQMLKPQHYFRFQCDLKEAYDDMDNADATNLRALRNIATAFINSKPARDDLKDLAGLI